MNTAVNEALKRCFAEKRVVFWYDEGGKCRAEFDESEVEGVEKLVIGGNEFGIKYRILAEKPDGKFRSIRRRRGLMRGATGSTICTWREELSVRIQSR